MTEERAAYDRMLKNVVLLSAAGLVKCEGEEDAEPQVFLGGAAAIMQNSESADIRCLGVLLETLEGKHRLVHIITECLRTGSSGPVVRIGLERDIPGMNDWTLILSPCPLDHPVTGGLGVIGPSRMEYDKTIGLVDHVARLVGTLLHRN
jgi:heat-inducible transcriptional repressor